ncbi:hypothetical protein SOPP22_04145 [Shewanella sp. OPT22]|nr:hypothetical protein SOPP22_04145 [Shewanella sp. OPT22]
MSSQSIPDGVASRHSVNLYDNSISGDSFSPSPNQNTKAKVETLCKIQEQLEDESNRNKVCVSFTDGLSQKTFYIRLVLSEDTSDPFNAHEYCSFDAERRLQMSSADNKLWSRALPKFEVSKVVNSDDEFQLKDLTDGGDNTQQERYSELGLKINRLSISFMRGDELYAAVCSDNIGKVEQLLQEGANPVKPVNLMGWRAPSIAACSGKSEILDLLLSNGVPPNVKVIASNKTLLYLAVENNHCAAVEILLKHNANTELTPNSKNDAPLFLAIKKGREDIAEVLLNKGAKLCSGPDELLTCPYRKFTKKYGKSPVECALKNKQYELAKKIHHALVNQSHPDIEQSANAIIHDLIRIGKQSEAVEFAKQYIEQAGDKSNVIFNLLCSHTSISDETVTTNLITQCFKSVTITPEVQSTLLQQAIQRKQKNTLTALLALNIGHTELQQSDGNNLLEQCVLQGKDWAAVAMLKANPTLHKYQFSSGCAAEVRGQPLLIAAAKKGSLMIVKQIIDSQTDVAQLNSACKVAKGSLVKSLLNQKLSELQTPKE